MLAWCWGVTRRSVGRSEEGVPPEGKGRKGSGMGYQDYIVRFADVEWQSPGEFMRHKVFDCGAQRMRVMELQRGMQHPEWCPKGHAGYILEGKLSLEFEDGTVVLGPGDAFLVPSGTAAQHRPTPATDRLVMVLVESVGR